MTALRLKRLTTTANKNNISATTPKDSVPKQNVADKAQKDTIDQKSTKTQAQLDEELRQKMSGLAGDGGEAGIEYENGEPVAMKKSVKNNMFRYI